MTISVTSEFREEFEAERLDWLRRRFLWYTGVISGLSLLDVIGTTVILVLAVLRDVAPTIPIVLIALALIGAGCYIGAFFFVKRTRRAPDRASLIKLVVALIMINGLVQLPEAPLWTELGPRLNAPTVSDQGDPAETAESATTRVAISPGPNLTISERQEDGSTVNRVGASTSWIFSVFMSHLFASLFIPWTPRESVRPLVPLLALNALVVVVFSPGSLLAKAIWIGLSPLVGVPGVGIAWWRHSRFRSRFSHRMLRKSYGDIKRELVDARRIHESLFPSPIEDGPVRFMYVYEPMRQIGGDFLFARAVALPDVPLPLLNVVVIDVTGHGITAALTVNRLAGEIEREFGEKPAAEPGEILHGLNAYLHHTLARHSVYATALCLRIDPNTDELIWASAGHPSAFLRTAAGRIDRLDSTTLLLGACRADDFYANPQRIPFHVGDSALIYTDGATETRDSHGRMLRTDGMQKIVASIDPGANGGWCGDVLQAIDHFRHGPPQDDTLIVEVARPVG